MREEVGFNSKIGFLSFKVRGAPDPSTVVSHVLNQKVRVAGFPSFAVNFFVDLQNFLAQINPQPEEFGLERNTDGSLVSPKKLVSIQSERSRSPIPSFGFVFDF